MPVPRTLSTSLVLAAVCLVMMAAAPAQAQPVRPNILLLFDTSGSMLKSDNGFYYDGSQVCNGSGDDSRIARSKSAMRQTLATVGIDEANFGLARFPEKEDPQRALTCPAGRTFQDDTTTINGQLGCKMSGHAGQTSYGPWFDADLQQFLLVEVTRKPQGLYPSAADFDPPQGNISRIYPFIDLVENDSNPEVRSGQGYQTPLGRSIFYARMYFDGYIKPRDPKAGCRQNAVILVTDGDETCDAVAPTGWDDTTCTGKIVSEFHPRVQACRLFREAGVRTFVLTDLGTKADADLIAQAGGTGKSIRVDLRDPQAVKSALLGMIAETVPPPELCDGKDNDCDGLTDEDAPGVGSQCSCPGLTDAQVGVGACKKGVTVCQGAQGIVCEGCVAPSTEVCNGKDDNCNREVDEGFALSLVCDNKLQGVCRRVGATECSADGSATMCSADGNVMPGTEVCNGLDDDCDGQTDERDGNQPLPGEGVTCGNNLEMCTAGQIVCDAGLLVCKQAALDVPELCNGVDDNCNGLVDDKIGGQACACPGLDIGTLMTGECRPGRLVCKGREPLDCVDCVGPVMDVCDGKDNDCDGQTDEEESSCTAGRLCVEGKCALRCQDSEFPCPVGFECVDLGDRRYCKNARCANVQCPRGQQCDESTGACVDPCEGVSCAGDLTCFLGQCVDCYQAGCADGEVCRAGRCEANKCADAATRCGPGQFCAEDGQCLALCPMSCPVGHRCTPQGCIPDACANVTCKANEICDPLDGGCRPDLCQLRACPGQTCVRTTGQCADDPCNAMACPTTGCYQCQVTVDGQGICLVDPACQGFFIERRIRTGGSGCGCAVPGTPAPGGGPTVLLGLGLVGLWLVRRRR